MKYLLPLLILPLLLSACGTTQKTPQDNNFIILQTALQKKDTKQFCNNLSGRSRSLLRPSCKEALANLWPELESLFQDTSFLKQEDNLVFIKKEGSVLSYPVYKEQGKWRADIIGDRRWLP